MASRQCKNHAIRRSVGVPRDGCRTGAGAGKNTAPANFTLAQILKPAIDLARGGLSSPDNLADTLPMGQGRLARWRSGTQYCPALTAVVA